MKKTIYKILNYIIVALIIAFLLKYLISNWQKIDQYNFDLNILLLVLSVFGYSLVLVLLSLVWRKIIGTIDGEHKISRLEGTKIYMLSEFGKYLPGNIWGILGRIYLGNQSGISKRTLLVASSMDTLLSPIASLLVGTLALFAYLGQNSSPLYIISLFVLIAGALFLHPKIMYPCFNLILKMFGKTEIEKRYQLGYGQIARLCLYYIVVAVGGSLCFVVFIASLTPLASADIFVLIAAYCLSKALGTVAPFAPSGLGVREGVMSLILNVGTLVSISVFISFAARIWSTVAEVMTLGLTYLANRMLYTVTDINNNEL